MAAQFVSDAADVAAQARSIAGDVARDTDAARERLEEARTVLQLRIAAHLADRADPALKVRLEEADAAERTARDALDRAEMFEVAARRNLADAEQRHLEAQRREASDTIQTRTAELIALSAEADAALNTLVRLLNAGHALDTTIIGAARTLDAAGPVKWRSATARRAQEVIAQCANGLGHGEGPNATESARRLAQRLATNGFYSPSRPDSTAGGAE